MKIKNNGIEEIKNKPGKNLDDCYTFLIDDGMAGHITNSCGGGTDSWAYHSSNGYYIADYDTLADFFFATAYGSENLSLFKYED